MRYQNEVIDQRQSDVCQQIVADVWVDGLKQAPMPSEQNRSREAAKLGDSRNLVHVADGHFD